MRRTQRFMGFALIATCALAVVSGSIKADPPSGDAPAAAAEPVPDRDIMFGHQDLELGIDRDTIAVGNDLGKFNRIRLRVLGSDVHVEALRVVFDDLSHQDISIGADIKADTHSGWFDIDGDKFIHEIQLTYQAQPGNKSQARIEVTGEYAKGWLAAAGEGRNYHQGWVLLGAQTAGFTGFDRDVIAVGENEGGFTRLRIEAVDCAITLRQIRVKFASGPDEVFAMHERIDPGKPYGPLEFKSGRAPIKTIEALYRSRFDLEKGLKSAFDGRPAVVQIWGQH
jgi:hypothetical protein